MIYILIAIIINSDSALSQSTVKVEFNSQKACQAAAAKIVEQVHKQQTLSAPILICAAKV